MNKSTIKLNNNKCYDYYCPPDPPLPPYPIPPSPPSPSNPLKAIGIFNFDPNIDFVTVQSYYTYWYLNPDFIKFPMLDYKGDIQLALELLETYYNLGYRIFINAFFSDDILLYYLDWFKNHPDAIGINDSSISPLLAVPKNFYRIVPVLNQADNFFKYINPSRYIYYIYAPGPTSDFYVQYMSDLYGADRLKLYPVDSIDQLTIPLLQQFLIDSNDQDVICLYLRPEWYTTYYDLYNGDLNFLGNQLLFVGAGTDFAPITGDIAQTKLNFKLFLSTPSFSNTQPLFNSNSFDGNSNINVFLLLKKFEFQLSLDTTPSYVNILQFNEFNDLKYFSNTIQQYQKDPDFFIDISIFIKDPLLGTFYADII